MRKTEYPENLQETHNSLGMLKFINDNNHSLWNPSASDRSPIWTPYRTYSQQIWDMRNSIKEVIDSFGYSAIMLDNPTWVENDGGDYYYRIDAYSDQANVYVFESKRLGKLRESIVQQESVKS